MVRFSWLSVFLVLSSACTSIDGSAAGLLDPGTTGGPEVPVDDPGSLAGGNHTSVAMPVDVGEVSGDLMVTVVRPTPDGLDQILTVTVMDEAIGDVRLPEVTLAAGEWKVAVRAMLPDGRPGEYLDVSSPSLIYSPVDTLEMPAGWWIRPVVPGAPLRPAEDGLSLGDRLGTVEVGVLHGEIADEVEEYEFSVGFVETLRDQSFSITTDAFVVDERLFSVGVEGPPYQENDGAVPTFAAYWPKAYLDNDGVPGFMASSDLVVGETCAYGKPVGFAWNAPAFSLSRASVLLRAGVRGGWTPVRVAEVGVSPLKPDAPIRFQGQCIVD